MKYTARLLSLVLLLGSQPVLAATPALWDEMSAMPPESLQVKHYRAPAADEAYKGKIEFVPLSPIHFESDKAMINHEGQLALDAAVHYLSRHQNISRILVEGHADWQGEVNYNDNLSDRRAEIVRNYLTIQGIDPNLISLVGKGENQPVDINWSREGRQRNRHVSIYAVHVH